MSINIHRTESQILFSSFLQFFADVKEAQDKMKKMQENMKKKYSCDRTTTATRLEDLLQDAVVSAFYIRLNVHVHDHMYCQSFVFHKKMYNQNVVLFMFKCNIRNVSIILF